MRNKLRSFAFALMLLVSTISFSGCFWLLFGAAAGAGGYAWVSGALEKEFDVSAEKLTKATLKGLDALDVQMRKEDTDRLSAKIRAEFSDGQDLNINVNAITERSAKLRIRIGIFGNRERSEMVLNAIMKYL